MAKNDKNALLRIVEELWANFSPESVANLTPESMAN